MIRTDAVIAMARELKSQQAEITALREAVRVLAESVYLVECDVDCDALHRGINNNPIAKAALDAARSGT